MKLCEIILSNYRNIQQMKLSPCSGINVIYGNNAQGKTNLIEGIWLFTGNPSFRGTKSGDLIRFDQEEASLSIVFSDCQREQKASLQFGKTNRRRILLNGVDLKTAGDFNGNFYAVVFSPAHLPLIKDGPRYRRQFLDIAISQIRPQYKSYLTLYEKLLEQRNALLRNASAYSDLERNIDVWDIQLAKAGTILSIYRNDYIKKLQPVAELIYQGLSGEKESLGLSYLSTVYENISSVDVYDEEKVSLYYQRLKESYSADLRQGFTGVGVHRDDLEVSVNDVSVRTFGSQGQQRSCVITLKLAEARLLRKVTGENPVMLLDDVMSELDESRQDYILNHLKGMQVFITCCDVSNTARMQSGKIFRIDRGTLAEETSLAQ